MKNSRYKDLLENFLGQLENSSRNIADQNKQLNGTKVPILME